MISLKSCVIFICRLQILDWFAHCSLQISDFAQYVIKPSDELSEIPPKLSFIPDIMLNPHRDPEKLVENDEVKKTGGQKNSEEEEPAALVNGDIAGEVQAKVDENDEYEDVDTSESEPEEEKTHKKHSSSHSRHKGRKGHKSGSGGKKGGKRAKQTVKFEPEFPKCLPGEKVAVGVCYTFSTATVMWQVQYKFHSEYHKITLSLL